MRTQEANNIHISDYLTKIGAKFARTQMGTHGLEYVYHSPLREDKNPSLCVNQDKNIWSDVPYLVGGRLIDLVCYLNSTDSVSDALRILDGLFSGGYTSASTQPKQTAKKHTAKIEIVEIKKLYSFALKNYLQQERFISLKLAEIYLKEVRYKFQDRNTVFYALGFPAGYTYTLRNKNFKGFGGLGANISIIDKNTDNILVFEGFMDFLTYLEAKKIQTPQHTAIILNSSSFIGGLISHIQKSGITTVDYFRDRDDAGFRTLEKLQESCPDVLINDKSDSYKNHKDLNQWWIERSKAKNAL